MREVKAISDEEKIRDIEDYLKKKNERDYLLFLIAISTGLRIGDILKLRVEDVYNKNVLLIKEQKTRKKKEVELSPKLKKEIKSFCKSREGYEYLIKSRQGINKPITRHRAYQIIKKTAELHGLNDIACHSIRKTFGRKYYEKYRDIEELRKYFNHSTSSVTLRYIGLEQEIINKHVRELWD
ncbi:tyrosine-type recombinase/integrase [Clostridium paraputrificum]|uniref:tyrosine-type recombinase/integrase n=1 Tax=Clostridium paraputrificum TaxID=29363 RepID=UPI000C086AD9|nr:tyrosine-type recombinase/integrase [Clostridium paraputrificum]